MMVPYRVYVVRGIRHLINTQRRERCPAVDMPEVKSNERIRVLLWETCCWSAACNSFIGTAWCDSYIRDEWAIVPELVTGHSWQMGLCVSPWRSRRGPMEAIDIYNFVALTHRRCWCSITFLCDVQYCLRVVRLSFLWNSILTFISFVLLRLRRVLIQTPKHFVGQYGGFYTPLILSNLCKAGTWFPAS